MSDALPAGWTWRRPELPDAEAIWAFVSAHHTAIVGFPDFTLDDARDELSEPGFDAANDGWLVHDCAGAVAGYGWACRNGTSAEIDIDVIATDETVADWLWAEVIERAGKIGAELDHDEVAIDVGIYRADELQRRRAAQLGLERAATFHRMRIEHSGDVAEPRLPPGIFVRTGEHEQVRRDAHAVMNAAFAGQFGFVERTFDQWHELVDASSRRDWSQLRVADVDGNAVAMLLGNDQFVADESCGYVARVGVIAAARGRGLATLLLGQAFAADARNGRTGTILHVDTDNPTPALGLYESVGMRPVLVIDVWRRSLRAGEVSETIRCTASPVEPGPGRVSPGEDSGASPSGSS